jgi:hypothetical protein
MKHISYLFPLIISVTLLVNHAKTTLPTLCFEHTEGHKEYAQQWVSVLFDEKSVLHTGEEDIQIILNLLYFSAIRSQINIQAQESALAELQKIWEGWTNIIARRRNPSKPLVYPHAALDAGRLAEEHEKNLIAHDKLCTLYDLTLEQTLKGTILENRFLLNHLTFLRDHSRRITLQAALNVRSELDALAHYVEGYKTRSASDVTQPLTHSISDFINYLLDTIPGWTYQSFIAADKLFIKASELNWSALYTASKITNSIWEKLERARGSFYAALYQELYRQAELRGIKPMLAFNKHGLIPANRRKSLLPH